MDIGLLLMSFLVGVLIGLTSMGGAALMAPFLILVLGVRPTVAVQTDLLYGAVTKIVGAAIHWSQGTVDTAVSWRMALGSVPGGLIGSALVFLLPRLGYNADQWLKRAVGIVLVMVALVLIARMFYSPGMITDGPVRRIMQSWGTPLWGCVVGFCVGLTSVGSGSLIAPFLMLFFPFSAAKVVGTDVFHAAILITATGFAHSLNGGIEWHLIGVLLAGSIPGVFIGSHLAPRVPAKTLRAGLAVLLLATGVRLV
jgi:uncharacterized membrane protein YfcA